jgi:hypothetical protein
MSCADATLPHTTSCRRALLLFSYCGIFLAHLSITSRSEYARLLYRSSLVACLFPSTPTPPRNGRTIDLQHRSRCHLLPLHMRLSRAEPYHPAGCLKDFFQVERRPSSSVLAGTFFNEIHPCGRGGWYAPEELPSCMHERCLLTPARSSWHITLRYPNQRPDEATPTRPLLRHFTSTPFLGRLLRMPATRYIAKGSAAV